MLPGDKLTIETPEQTVIEFPLAGIGSRSLALAIDMLLQAAALTVAVVVAGLLAYAGFLHQVGKQWIYAILTMIGFLVEFAYFAFFEAIWNGQTPGKRWTHLRVIADSGRPISAQDAILRNLLRIVDYLPSLYAIGIISCLISPQNKRLGDYLAGTVVVHEKPLEDARSLWDRPATPLLATTQSRTLSTAELQLVESFLDRRHSFSDEVRRSMARQIAERFRDGSPVPDETVKDPEKFLEALGEHSRNAAHFR
jgi:uncharacterized RDD family membrane protein YckC